MSYNQDEKLNKHKTYTKRPDGSLRLSIKCINAEGSPRTEQSHRAECDIKNIVRRYRKEGTPFTLPDESRYTGENYVAPPDYAEAMRRVAAAHSMFAEQPSHIRDRFQNDPQRYLEFLDNPANAEEAVALGIAKFRPIAPPPAAPNEASAAGKGTKKAEKTPAGKPDGGQPEGGSDQ